MNGIKVEIRNLRSLPNNDFCLICLKTVTSINSDQKDLLKYIFNYLKVSDDGKELFVCKVCEEKLAKFVKLCGILDKTMMEMDYLLECVQNGISSSSKDLKPAYFRLYSVREAVAANCGERLLTPRPKMNLERLDFSKLIIRLRSESHISDRPEKLPSIPVSNSGSANSSVPDSIPNSASNSSKDLFSIPDTASRSTSSHSDLQPFTSAAPVVSGIENIKVNLEDTRKMPEAKKVKRTNRTQNNLRCPKCFKTFATKQVLTRHNDFVHLRLKPFKCDVCDKAFAYANLLKRHKTSHSCLKMTLMKGKAKVFKAPQQQGEKTSSQSSKDLSAIPVVDICSTSSESDLQPDSQDAPVIEEIEDKGEMPLKKRVGRTKYTPKNLKCPKCFKTFATKQVLTRHNDFVHLRLKPCKCSKCPKSFRDVMDLRVHVNSVHLRLKPFKCDLCDLSFARNSNLTSHKRDMHHFSKIIHRKGKAKVFNALKPKGEKKSSHPSPVSMVFDAITKLNEEGGSSLVAIKKFIADNHKVDVGKLSVDIKNVLKKAVDSGKLIQPRGKGAAGSFKFSIRQ